MRAVIAFILVAFVSSAIAENPDVLQLPADPQKVMDYAQSRFYDVGLQAYKENKFAMALEYWTMSSNSDPRSQFGLSVLYMKGQGVAVDAQKAIGWIRKSAAQAYPAAEWALGMVYETGGGVKQDPVQAAQWYLRAADHGYADAQEKIGVMYLQGTGVSKNPSLGTYYLNQADNQGNAAAKYDIGTLYERGEGVRKNSDIAYTYFASSAAQGYAAAEYALAKMYYNGEVDGKRDVNHFFDWLKKAAVQGYVPAEADLGWSFANAAGVERDDQWAVYWSALAAAHGDKDAAGNAKLYASRLQQRTIAADSVKILTAADVNAETLELSRAGMTVVPVGGAGEWTQVYVPIYGNIGFVKKLNLAPVQVASTKSTAKRAD